MNWYLATLSDAIRDRAEADTGSGGLFETGSTLISGIYLNKAPAQVGAAGDPAFPYVVFSTGDGFNDDSFRTRTVVREITFDVYQASEESGVDVADVSSKIIGRLIGDWTEQSAGSPPSFGFDRFVPDLSAVSWSAGPMQFESDADLSGDEDGLLRYRLTFSLRVNKAGA